MPSSNHSSAVKCWKYQVVLLISTPPFPRQFVSKFELKEIYSYPEGSERLCRLVLAAIIILIFHKIQSHFVGYEEENLGIAKCESLLSAFSCRNKRPNSENKALAEG